MKDQNPQEFFRLLRGALSVERIGAYRLQADDEEIDLFCRYLWNIALCESFYPILNIFEVALRNEMDRIMRRTFHERWLDQPDPNLLRPVEFAMIEEAKQKLLARGRPLNGGSLIAELSFGFWTSLFNARYEMRIWRPVFADRSPDRGFPFLPKRLRTRRILSNRLTEIRWLRNRIFHHEPIWHQADLSTKHLHIHEAVYWISPALYEMVRLFDRFPGVYSGTPDKYREMLSSLS